MAAEVIVEILGLTGAASPFKQGGSLRITLPRKIARAYVAKISGEALEDVTFFFVRTNMGILMCTLSELAKHPALRDLVISRGTGMI